MLGALSLLVAHGEFVQQELDPWVFCFLGEGAGLLCAFVANAAARGLASARGMDTIQIRPTKGRHLGKMRAQASQVPLTGLDMGIRLSDYAGQISRLCLR